MSRSTRTPGPLAILGSYKRTRRKRTRAAAKDRLRHEGEPERERRSDSWEL